MIAFSPGLAQGCFDLLEMAGRRALQFGQISIEFARLGGMPAARVVDTAQTLDWLRASEDGTVVLTPGGARLVDLRGYEPRLRRALLDYIDTVRPSWIQNATFGRARVLAFAGSDIAQVFVEAGLAYGISDEVVAFWDEMAARARGQKGARLTGIGRAGERLTIAHERERTGREPKWISVESNEDGYDVLSVAGPGDARLLSIEVKATTVGIGGGFHLTANEWDRAVLNDIHAFHLWDISRPVPSLAALSKAEVDPHVPTNRGEGTWESVEIPFNAFAEKFLPQPNLLASRVE
ncbi:DUF3883 domain-containing protein [Sulfurisoma sediminicola]|uniref:Uncharacterized protein DUF3883 n=1 Tax=Sulfurisoma sediminicola TaxID=1381557 RepID=A0A497XDI7_9PROT|nr:DUF3883 domain-containing protein [Sulfurisoma sediminicola]RLJ64615.1 uncharacterized protein DUF3883 [Sulfurisoma sediminicola]